ncbi:MAG TPA: ABC transporter substrate-binding protein [Actinomycetota bacterium]|nr:ABC transporter substrate-binding protein [Actinomycetota bacterium]
MLRRSVVMVFVVCLAAAACSTADEPEEGGGGASGPASGEPIVIGFPADLTTDWAYYDAPMQEGAQFAVDQINEEGGVLGRPLELQTVDMRNDLAEATKVTQQLIDDGAAYLIGTVGDGILAEGQVACTAGVPISTGLGSAPTLVGDMGECAYQLMMSDNIQAAVLAEYAVAQGYETVYVLGSNEIPYTRDLPTFFTDAFEQGGGSVVAQDEYKIGAGDYSAVVTKIANTDPAPDAIFTPMFIPDSAVFLRQLRQAGVETPVLSTDGNADAALLDAGAKAIDGLTFSNSVCTAEGDPDVQAFYDEYEAAYGEDPSSYVAVIGYDEVNFVAEAIEAADSTEPDAIIEQLATLDTAGISGDVTMDPETRRANKSVALIQMNGTEFTCLERPEFPDYVPTV